MIILKSAWHYYNYDKNNIILSITVTVCAHLSAVPLKYL